MHRINSTGSLKLCDMSTGETLCELGSPLESKIEENISVNTRPEISLTLEGLNIGAEIIKQISDEPLKYNCELSGKTIVNYKQVKTHKKNRINKKWKKRYGCDLVYENVDISMKDCKLNYTGDVNVYELQGSIK